MQKAVPPLLIAVVLAITGLVAVWAREPLLVPSLGSAVFAQVLSPKAPNASFYSTGVGQLLGLVGGFVGVYAAQAAGDPAFMGSNPLLLSRVLAVVIAVVVAAVLQLPAKATSPAGGATALIIALGAETPTAAGAARIVAGIALVTLLGEGARRIAARME